MAARNFPPAAARTVVLAAADPAWKTAIEAALVPWGYSLRAVAALEDLSHSIESEAPALVLLVARGPADAWLHVLRVVHANHPDLPVIVLGEANEDGLTWKAIGAGAFDVQLKPLDLARLVGQVGHALTLSSNGASLSGDGTTPEDEDRTVMRHLYRAARRIAAADRPVLLRGEPGVGKKFLARIIHAQSPRANGPFVVASCARLDARPGHPDSLDEALIRAGGGTLVLDRVENLTLEARSRLLESVESADRPGVYARLHPVRLILTSECALENTGNGGGELPEFLEALGEVSLYIPPLRAHRGDIPALAHELLAEVASGLGMSTLAISPEAMRTLTSHDWPGNLRELRRMLTQSLLLFRGSVLRAEDVRRAIDGKLWREETAIGTATAEMLGQCVRDFVGRFGGDGCHERLIEAVEREALREALRRGGGSQTRAAGVLGIPRPTLHAKLERRGVRSNGAAPPVSL